MALSSYSVEIDLILISNPNMKRLGCEDKLREQANKQPKLRSCLCVRRSHVPNTACFPASFVFSLLRGRKWHFASLILKRAFCLIGGAKESVDVEQQQQQKAIVCDADETKPEIYF